MKFERKHAQVFLGTLWIVVLAAMYKVLFGLGPLKEELLRYPGDPMRNGYKIFFFSMEAAAVTYIAFTVVLLGSAFYLKTKDMKWDRIASSSARLGLVFTTILLINGAIFSNLAWGAYWNWDPRQTSSLFLWFTLAAYLTLRGAVDGVETRARLSAVLGIFGFVGVPLTHISTTIWLSNHPALYDTAQSTGFSLDRSGLILFMTLMTSFLALYIYLLWLTVKIDSLEEGSQKVFSGEL
ncbi:heme exporter protein C [archaeon BMS3Abin16]|nr:heme exporter protein C [archaeon BMS3Abin16]HDY74481.1 cytochrome C assembly protein [Euryarchaeota archaeon]